MADSHSAPVGTVYESAVSLLNLQQGALPQLIAVEVAALLTADR